MVFGPLIGAAAGAAAGAAVGGLVFSGDRPKDYTFVTEGADRDANIRVPVVANVTDEMRGIIPLTPEWTYWPDYERWQMINRLLRLMWPKLTTAILKQVIQIVKPMVQQALNGIPSVLAVLDDITLGNYSIMDAEHLHPHLTEKYFTLGDFPVRVAGMKVYHTADETCILETPVCWGSNAAFDIQLFLRVAGFRVVVPISVRDIQFRVTARMILHMVDTMPCIGGATLSLLTVPHVDFRLHLFNGPDMMALPGVKPLVDWVTRYVVAQLALYPNSISVPLMENFGVPKAPKGMVHVRLHKITNLKSTDLVTKGDPYVVFEVRAGRSQRSKVIKNCANPEFNQEFYLLVDDFDRQALSIKVYDYDRLCPVDDLLGTTEVFFTDEEVEEDEATGAQRVVYHPKDWVASPMIERRLELPLQQAGSGLLKAATKAAAAAAKSAASAAASLVVGGAEVQEGIIIRAAKTKKEVREAAEREAAAKAAADAAKAAADAAKAAKAARAEAEAAGPEALAAYEAALAAEAKAKAWTQEDEKAYWAEVKRLADEKKAADAAEAKRRKALTKEQREAEDAAKKAAEEAAKAADEEVVLVDARVVLRGNGPPATAVKSVGTLHLSVQFMPFDQPAFDDDIELQPVKSGLSAFVPFDPPKPREFQASVNDFQKGVLTVTIFKASGLTVPGSLLSPDPYVEMVLVDCDRMRASETQKTSVKYNDSTPRFIETFDFVMVSAGSILTLNVMNKVTLLDIVASLKISKSRFQDSMLGRVQIPVADVARNGCLKDTFALLDAESGTIEMKLEWQNCYVDQYMD